MEPSSFPLHQDAAFHATLPHKNTAPQKHSQHNLEVGKENFTYMEGKMITKNPWIAKTKTAIRNHTCT